MASYSQSGGTLAGAETLTVTGSGVRSGGTMSGGLTVIPAGATLGMTGGNAKVLGQRTLQVGGTVNHGGGTLDFGGSGTSVLAILPSGTYN